MTILLDSVIVWAYTCCTAVVTVSNIQHMLHKHFPCCFMTPMATVIICRCHISRSSVLGWMQRIRPTDVDGSNTQRNGCSSCVEASIRVGKLDVTWTCSLAVDLCMLLGSFIRVVNIKGFKLATAESGIAGVLDQRSLFVRADLCKY